MNPYFSPFKFQSHPKLDSMTADLFNIAYLAFEFVSVSGYIG